MLCLNNQLTRALRDEQPYPQVHRKGKQKPLPLERDGKAGIPQGCWICSIACEIQILPGSTQHKENRELV